jgi:phosphomannomutase
VDFTGASVKFHRADGRIEAATAAGARVSEAMRLELEQFFGPKQGFGRVERINTLDGLRVWFSNGDIAHVRPSGNAPQLRIYAVADSLSRAEQIVTLGLREPDGILRKLESAASRYSAEEKVRANQGEL